MESTRTDIDGEATGDLSGTSVAISKDGSKIVIGAENNDSGAFCRPCSRLCF